MAFPEHQSWCHAVQNAPENKASKRRLAELWLPLQGTGHLRGASVIEGLLVRDLQLQPKSRFAFFLRPLPARAEELTLHATRFRTQMLRVVRLSPARRRYTSWQIGMLPTSSEATQDQGFLPVICSCLSWTVAAFAVVPCGQLGTT